MSIATKELMKEHKDTDGSVDVVTAMDDLSDRIELLMEKGTTK